MGGWMSMGLCSRIFTMVGFPGLNSRIIVVATITMPFGSLYS